MSFFELMLRCRQHGEIAIGYRLVEGRKTVINPGDKHQKELDLNVVEAVIVLADDG